MQVMSTGNSNLPVWMCFCLSLCVCQPCDGCNRVWPASEMWLCWKTNVFRAQNLSIIPLRLECCNTLLLWSLSEAINQLYSPSERNTHSNTTCNQWQVGLIISKLFPIIWKWLWELIDYSCYVVCDSDMEAENKRRKLWPRVYCEDKPNITRRGQTIQRETLHIV